MPLLSILSAVLAAAALVLYATSPSQLLYSTHPLPAYALLLAAALAAWLGRPGKARLALLVLVPVLAGAVFYVHSVRSLTPPVPLTIAAGDPFPDVTLPTSTGVEFSSADLRGRSAALYVFYRGDWCPFCRTELGALNGYYAPIRAGGVELFAVSVDPPEASERLRARLGVPFTFLSDEDGRLLDRLGIRHRGGHDGRDIAYPAQVLVDRDGVVRWTFRADSYRQRADPEDVMGAIARLGAGSGS